MDDIIFEDIFDVKDIDPEGPKFDRGSLVENFFFFNFQLLILNFYLSFEAIL